MDVPPKEKKEILEKIFNVMSEKNIKFAINTTVPPSLIPIEKLERYFGKFGSCSFPYTLGIDSSGEVAPCDGFLGIKETILGNVREKSIEEIWNHPLMRRLRAIGPDDLKGVCKKCKFVEFCMGGCRAAAYLEYKDFRMPDPICQELYERGLFPKEYLKK